MVAETEIDPYNPLDWVFGTPSDKLPENINDIRIEPRYG